MWMRGQSKMFFPSISLSLSLYLIYNLFTIILSGEQADYMENGEGALGQGPAAALFDGGKNGNLSPPPDNVVKTIINAAA